MIFSFMKVNEETRKKAGNKKLVFDVNRTTMTGFSLYAEDAPIAPLGREAVFR